LSWKCLPEKLKQIDIPIIVQANIGFIKLLKNLIYSADAVGVSKSRFLVWALDLDTQFEMNKLGVRSYYDPERFFGISEATKYHSKDYNKMMRQRSVFWLYLLQNQVSFWWIDADVSLAKNIDELIDLKSSTDLYIQMDGPFWVHPAEIDTERMPLKHIPGRKWVEACAGFFFVKANDRSMNFFRKLDTLLFNHADLEDQQAMNLLLQNDTSSELVYQGKESKKPILHWEFFAQVDVTSGHVYCMHPPFGYWPSEAKRDPYAFHMNCVKHHEKQKKLQELHLWYIND
jgi:hypothetical protein